MATYWNVFHIAYKIIKIFASCIPKWENFVLNSQAALSPDNWLYIYIFLVHLHGKHYIQSWWSDGLPKYCFIYRNQQTVKTTIKQLFKCLFETKKGIKKANQELTPKCKQSVFVCVCVCVVFVCVCVREKEKNMVFCCV